jgi:hypothetical protein
VGELDEIAFEECNDRLVAYSRQAANDPSIGIYYMHPTSQSWNRGDRQIVCIAATDIPRFESIKD